MSNLLLERSRAGAAAWWLVRTRRYDEERAGLHLQRCGYRTYLPRILRWPRPVVGSSVAPLFPGYLFVRAVAAQEQRRVMRTPGVIDFVRASGAEPATVPGGVIEFLRKHEDHDGLIDCRALSNIGSRRLPIGDDLVAEFSEVLGRTHLESERAVSLLDLLRSTTDPDARRSRLRRAG